MTRPRLIRSTNASSPLYAESDDPPLLTRINLQTPDRALFNIASDTDTLIDLLNLRTHFPELDKIPDDDGVLNTRDCVVLIMAAEKEQALEQFFETREGLAHQEARRSLTFT